VLAVVQIPEQGKGMLAPLQHCSRASIPLWLAKCKYSGWGESCQIAESNQPSHVPILVQTQTQRRDDGLVCCWWGYGKVYYYFDFLNYNGKYIHTPDDVKIYLVATAFCPSIKILSIEQSLANLLFQLQQQLSNPFEYAHTYDPHWETYLIPEGTSSALPKLTDPMFVSNYPCMHLVNLCLSLKQ
jgi:hypothetical protein